METRGLPTDLGAAQRFGMGSKSMIKSKSKKEDLPSSDYGAARG